jgi:hypothetical protein
MKKIALCISGVPREHFNVGLLSRLQNNHHVTVFMHYWQPEVDLLAHKNNRIHSPHPDAFIQHGGNYACGYKVFDPNYYAINGAEVHVQSDVFADKKPYFEELFKQINPARLDARQDLGVLSMFYSIQVANNMREEYERDQGVLFDCVMRTRFEADFACEYAFDLENFDLNKIYWPNYNIAPINDHFAFSNRENMTIYSNTFNNIVEFSNSDSYWPEKILLRTLGSIPTEQINFIRKF